MAPVSPRVRRRELVEATGSKLHSTREKLSKTKGTFISARTYLDAGLDPAFLRYYLSAKQNGSAEDLDLNLAEFVAKVNSDIVGKFVNLASRTARFIPALAAPYPDDGGLFAAGAAEGAAIAEDYDRGDSASAIRRIMTLADRANEYVERAAPWALKKDPTRSGDLAIACSIALNLFRQLAVYLAPVLPDLADKAGALLNQPITRFADAQTPLAGNAIAAFTHLLPRVDADKVADMVARSTISEAPSAAEPAAKTANPAGTNPTGANPAGTNPAGASTGTNPAPLASVAVSAEAPPVEPLAATIAIDDFAKLDLRVALVLSAEEVPKAKKIIKLRVSLGPLGERTIFAGIKASYSNPAELIGRHLIVVANLAPRTMSFGISEGMVIAASATGGPCFVLSPDSGAVPGMRVG